MARTPRQPFPRPSRRAELPAHVGRVARQLFASEGYAAVTMERIAACAGVSKRTLYKYFPVKEALLAHVLESGLAEDLAKMNVAATSLRGFRAGIAAVLRDSAHWCEQHSDILLPYVRYTFASFEPKAAPEEDRGLLPLWAALIGAGQRRGELASRHPPRTLGIYFHYLYLGALMRWLGEPGIDLRREFRIVVQVFLHGVERR